jgi:hypothetical protein
MTGRDQHISSLATGPARDPVAARMASCSAEAHLVLTQYVF